MTVATAKLIARLAPATPADCAKDYAQHQRPEVAVAVREQQGQSRTDGNAAAGFWHGRKD